MKLFDLFRRRKKDPSNSSSERPDYASNQFQELERLRIENEKLKQENEYLQKVVEQRSPEGYPRKKYKGLLLGEEQSAIIDLIEHTGNNYFITGKAGSGKSTVLKCFCETTAKRNMAVLSYTGLAAINVGGQTIHSFFGLELGFQDVEDPDKVASYGNIKEVLKNLDVIIIDEVSMVRVDIMDMIDAKMKYAKESDKPFGGCQIIAFGDLYQLPPFASSEFERKMISDRYETMFFFGAPAVKKSFTVYELQEVFRQKSKDFVDLLNHIRVGNVTEHELMYLNTYAGTAPLPQSCITLTPKRNTAAKINEERLAALPGEVTHYRARPFGDNPPKENEVPCDLDLQLKVGAQVMLVKNMWDLNYSNGTFAIIKELSPDCIKISVNGKIDKVERESWSKYKYTYNKEKRKIEKTVVGSLAQFPLKLSYAITVHKAQGRTFDDVIIDYADSTAFAAGQTYVALSRCTTLEHMHIASEIKRADIKTDGEAVNYMNSNARNVDLKGYR